MLCMASQQPKGFLCNGNVKVNVGLPPDAVFNMVTDPGNRLFNSIKVINCPTSKVLFSKGQRLVLEYEQSSYTECPVLEKFKLIKNQVLPRFEGCWKVAIDPLFVDEETCFPTEPKTLADYYSCTNGEGRIGSMVELTRPAVPLAFLAGGCGEVAPTPWRWRC
ncbi:hypothetical protein SLEP1_g32705 [Rubroshorea leprosula]|uniref:DUF220 domain-containing protein n=1 Tax=Rubroshorea leprosula TaxID=152421 RepID=A0AAV5KE72_9ROSI|nr:hypothetical protein SLEP1_g32705 [Rubroshorea leprosula]